MFRLNPLLTIINYTYFIFIKTKTKINDYKMKNLRFFDTKSNLTIHKNLNLKSIIISIKNTFNRKL